MQSRAVYIVAIMLLCLMIYSRIVAQDDIQTEHLVWSPDGSQIATAIQGEVVIWDVATQTIQHRIQTLRPDEIIQMAWSNDNRLALGFREREVGIWDTTTGQLITYLELEQGSQNSRIHFDVMSHIVWSPNDTYLATAAYMDGYLIWNGQDYTLHNELINNSGQSMVFDSETRLIGALMSNVRTYNIDITRDEIEMAEIIFENPYATHPDRLRGTGTLGLLKYDVTQEKLIAATFAGDIFVWDMQEAELINTFTVEEGFSSSENMVIIIDNLISFVERDGGIYRYNVIDGSLVDSITSDNPPRAAGWSPLGGRIAYLTSGTSGDEIQLEIDIVFSEIEDIQRLLSACRVGDRIEDEIEINELLEQLPFDAPVSCADEIIALGSVYNNAN